ncbi:MAG TPA: hypothetical protein VED47_13450 [Burkholderiaceae bacterium]|nr:hypothetical protein [Burkholderiaceae bacterium]
MQISEARFVGMRIRNHWFKSERPKAVAEVAGAVAFIAWRVAQQALRNMRRADFEINAGPQYFDFLTEWLIFLVQCADRTAWARLGEARVEFTTVLANRLGEMLADNRGDLLADAPPAEIKERFIDLLNLRLTDYADFESMDYGCLRYFAGQLAHVVGPRDTVWVHDQVMEIEAPQAIELVERGIEGLLDETPRQRRRQREVSGE